MVNKKGGKKHKRNKNQEVKEKSDLELFVAGSKKEVIMIEAGAKEVKEDDMFAAIQFAGKHIAQIIPFVEKIIKV